MMKNIYNRVIKIDKGFSNDKKYYVNYKNKDFLLRVSSIKDLSRIQNLFNIFTELNQFKILTCKPIEIIRHDHNVHTLYTWIQGKDMIDCIEGYSKDKQYQYGIKAGCYLKSIHTIKAPQNIEKWNVRFNRKIDRNINRYYESHLDFPELKPVIDYLNSNRHLLNHRPQCFHHGDYHIANFMIDKDDELVIIDFNRYDFGDPWEEFNRIVWSAQKSPALARGIVNGYFDNHVPDEFWRLLLLYISSNMLSSLTWASDIGNDQLKIMIEQTHDILGWYKGFKSTIPSWYK